MPDHKSKVRACQPLCWERYLFVKYHKTNKLFYTYNVREIQSGGHSRHAAAEKL